MLNGVVASSAAHVACKVGKGFNRDKWNELEEHVRRLTARYDHVFVCTGPLYLPSKQPDGKMAVHYEVIGESHVCVPTHFFKVLLLERAGLTGPTREFQVRLGCWVVGNVTASLLTNGAGRQAYLMPNRAIPDDVPLHSFLVPIETVERASGLLFYERARPRAG